MVGPVPGLAAGGGNRPGPVLAAAWVSPFKALSDRPAGDVSRPSVDGDVRPFTDGGDVRPVTGDVRPFSDCEGACSAPLGAYPILGG